MNSFWILVEQILNTLLFTLAGTVWGGVIGDAAGSTWGGADWGYMVLVYVLVNVIRFFLIGAFYPIVSRVGLKKLLARSNISQLRVSRWCSIDFVCYIMLTSLINELFPSCSGLRGAVGIALALSLDNEVRQATQISSDADAYVLETTRVFGIVGGVALLTLVVNGTSSGSRVEETRLGQVYAFPRKTVERFEEKYSTAYDGRIR